MNLIMKSEKYSPKDTVIKLNSSYEVPSDGKQNFVDMYTDILLKLGQDSSIGWKLEEIGIQQEDVLYAHHYNFERNETNVILFQTKKGVYFLTFYFDDLVPSVSEQTLRNQIKSTMKMYKFSSINNFVLNGLLDNQHKVFEAKKIIIEWLEKNNDEFINISFKNDAKTKLLFKNLVLKMLSTYNSPNTVEFVEWNFEKFWETFSWNFIEVINDFYQQALKDRNLKKYSKTTRLVL